LFGTWASRAEKWSDPLPQGVRPDAAARLRFVIAAEQ